MNKEVSVNYRTLSDMAALIRANLHRIPRLPVLGIPRSGMIAASMIATLKNVPLVNWKESLPREFTLVDDSVSGGETIKKYADILRHSASCFFHTMCVYANPNGPKPDIWLEELAKPRVFEWNWHKHAHTKHAVFDIDGVIATETEKVQNWDDIDHIRGVRERAQLLHWPARQVLAIATGRKEVERNFTEAWLERMSVRYKHIYFSTKERGARQTKLLAAQETGASWIVESNQEQAAWIHARSGIPVLCTDVNRMFCAPQSQG